MDFHRIQLGTNNAYLIPGREGYILVDGGNAFTTKIFSRYLKQNGIAPKDINLVVVTHVHFDHVGILGKIKKMCDCPVAVHESESDLLRNGEVVIPPGTNLLGRVASRVGWKLTRIFAFEPVDADIVVSDELSLDEFGLDGEILATPGHSDGSLSVLLSGGEAFVGDLAIDFLPFGAGYMPPFAGNVRELLDSWKKVLRAGAKTILPGHGRSISADLLERERRKLTAAWG